MHNGHSSFQRAKVSSLSFGLKSLPGHGGMIGPPGGLDSCFVAITGTNETFAYFAIFLLLISVQRSNARARSELLGVGGKWPRQLHESILLYFNEGFLFFVRSRISLLINKNKEQVHPLRIRNSFMLLRIQQEKKVTLK